MFTLKVATEPGTTGVALWMRVVGRQDGFSYDKGITDEQWESCEWSWSCISLEGLPIVRATFEGE